MQYSNDWAIKPKPDPLAVPGMRIIPETPDEVHLIRIAIDAKVDSAWHTTMDPPQDGWYTLLHQDGYTRRRVCLTQSPSAYPVAWEA